MSRKELISVCVDNQIARGIIKAENRDMQISVRLNGRGLVKPMSKAECEAWYNDVMKNKE